MYCCLPQFKNRSTTPVNTYWQQLWAEHIVTSWWNQNFIKRIVISVYFCSLCWVPPYLNHFLNFEHEYLTFISYDMRVKNILTQHELYYIHITHGNRTRGATWPFPIYENLCTYLFICPSGVFAIVKNLRISFKNSFSLPLSNVKSPLDAATNSLNYCWQMRKNLFWWDWWL